VFLKLNENCPLLSKNILNKQKLN